MVDLAAHIRTLSVSVHERSLVNGMMLRELWSDLDREPHGAAAARLVGSSWQIPGTGPEHPSKNKHLSVELNRRSTGYFWPVRTPTDGEHRARTAAVANQR